MCNCGMCNHEYYCCHEIPDCPELHYYLQPCCNSEVILIDQPCYEESNTFCEYCCETCRPFCKPTPCFHHEPENCNVYSCEDLHCCQKRTQNTACGCCYTKQEVVLPHCCRRKFFYGCMKPKMHHCCKTFCCKSTAATEEQQQIKARFGLVWISDVQGSLQNRPCGWQVEISDTPSRVEEMCKKMVEWVQCPPDVEFVDCECEQTVKGVRCLNGCSVRRGNDKNGSYVEDKSNSSRDGAASGKTSIVSFDQCKEVPCTERNQCKGKCGEGND